MNKSLMAIDISLRVIMPQALIERGKSYLRFLLDAVVDGRIPANIAISTAQDANAIALVPEVIRDEWLRQIAADENAMFNLKMELEAVGRDEDNRIEHAFYAWPAGTAVVDVYQWLKAQE